MAINRVILMGGLGNQLFQSAFAADLSSVTKSDVILDPNFLAIRLNEIGLPELNQFSLNESVRIASKKSESQIISRALGLTLRLHLTNLGFFGRIGYQVTRLITTVLVSARFRCWMRVYVASDNGYEKFKYRANNSLYLGYFQTFIFSDKIKKKNQKNHFSILNQSEVISKFTNLSIEEKPLLVHIRLTDYRNEPKFGIPTKEYYSRAIEYHLSRSDYSSIWAFSDEPEKAVSYIPDQYKGLVRNVSNEISDTAETLEVMRLAHGYVLANSSYSWWAAFSSHTNAPLVTYPSPWFAQMPDPNRLFPPHWQAIER
jgi:hypothetical protein